MKPMKPMRERIFLAGMAAALSVPAAVAAADAPAAGNVPAPDTSQWTCSQCPFFQGYGGDVEAGVQYADGANAYFGRYTGIDHTGPYADMNATGQWRDSGGNFTDYDLDDLGLDSRAGSIEGGNEGRYELRLSYDGQPNRLYDTAATPYRIDGNTLSLPPGWAAAGSTPGMTGLGSALQSIDLGDERRIVALQGRFNVATQWTVSGEFRHEERTGNDLTSASFLTDAVQLPLPIHYDTNSMEAGVVWAGSHGSLRLGYLGSWFSDDSAVTFANPYLPIVPGSTAGLLSQPPGNNLQQGTAAGNWQLPWWSTVLNFSGSVGRLRQNDAFVPMTTLADVGTLPAASLDGDVHLTHFTGALSLRPLSRLSVRGNLSYDGRDDATTPLAITYIVTDTFPGGTAVTPRYSEDRTRADGGADYTLARWLRIGVGGSYDDKHYGPGQILTSSRETLGWGRAMLTPLDSLSLSIKAGGGGREVSSFNADALPTSENPLLYAYDYAPRDHSFGTVTGSWAATSTLTWTVEGSLAKDDYRLSVLGLSLVHEQRASTTLAWTPSDALSLYADAGYDYLHQLQNGAGVALWSTADTEGFWNLSAGGHWSPQERWTLSLDYLLAPSYTDIDTTSSGLQQPFPQNWSRLQSARLDVRYQWTKALQVHLHYTREQFGSGDWALQGVGVASIPNLLSLGLQPYRDHVDLVGLTLRYDIEPGNAAPGRR